MQERKELHIQVTEILYLCFWGVMLFTKGIGLYDGQALYKLFLTVALGLVCLKMCITSHTLKEWTTIIVISILMVAVYFSSKEKGIIICTLVVLAMKDVSVKRVFKVGMYTWGITMCGNTIYHLMNLNASGYKVHEKLGLGHIFRWDLGFSHPNVFHISYLVLCGFIVYNLGKKYNWKFALGLMLGNLFVFMYSVSYTGIMIVTLYLILSLYINIRSKLSKLKYGLLELVLPISIFLSLASPFVLPRKIFWMFNKIFSNRLYLAECYLIPENIKLFGNNLENITSNFMTMDNAYVFSLIIYGVLFFMIIVFSYFFLIRKCARNEAKMELVLIVAFLIAGITEPFLFNTSFKNLTLIFMGAILFAERKEAKKWGIFPHWNKEFVLDFTKLSLFMEKLFVQWTKNKKKILMISIMLGLIAGVFCGVKQQMPKGYIVPRIHVDLESKETWYIENPESKEYEGYEILDYKDAETKMQILQGNIVTIEYFRGILSAFSITLVIVMAVSMIGLGVKELFAIVKT